MAVKAIATITNMGVPTATGTWKCTVKFSPTVTYSSSIVLDIDGLDPGILSVTLKAAIEDAVKTEMIAGGVTFGLLDSVRALVPTF